MLKDKVLNFNKGLSPASLFWVMAMSLVLGCGSEKTPPGILTQSQMAEALTDFYLKESHINMAGIPVDSAKVLMEYYQRKYTGQHTFPDTAITASYQYYLERPEQLSRIYDVVIDSLVLKEQKKLNPPSQKNGKIPSDSVTSVGNKKLGGKNPRATP